MSDNPDLGQAELMEAVAKVKRLDEAVELGWWDDWSVTLAEGVETLAAQLAQAQEQRQIDREEFQIACQTIDRLEEQLAERERAIRHVIEDSPGTPQSVKQYLSRVLADAEKEKP